MRDVITLTDVTETFSLWLRVLDQTEAVQEACIEQLRIYLVRICTDIFFLEANGPRSNWIWMALTDWDYLTYSLGVPSPDHLNLGDALDLANYRSSESSREDILTFHPNDLDDRQRRYINETMAIIRTRQ